LNILLIYNRSVRFRVQFTAFRFHTRVGSLPRQVELFVTPVTDDDYDFALARSPHLCRPLAAAMGDVRPARQCRADYAADLARPLPGLSDPEGSGLAAALSAVVSHAANGQTAQ
jgi:hypothetical protein